MKSVRIIIVTAFRNAVRDAVPDWYREGIKGRMPIRQTVIIINQVLKKNKDEIRS